MQMLSTLELRCTPPYTPALPSRPTWLHHNAGTQHAGVEVHGGLLQAELRLEAALARTRVGAQLACGVGAAEAVALCCAAAVEEQQ